VYAWPLTQLIEWQEQNERGGEDKLKACMKEIFKQPGGEFNAGRDGGNETRDRNSAFFSSHKYAHGLALLEVQGMAPKPQHLEALRMPNSRSMQG
ncbi:unnamed protein product, partial [Symbiodinium sp. CCMP2456]